MNGANSEENSAAHGTNTEERWEIDQLLHHARLSQYIPVFNEKSFDDVPQILKMARNENDFSKLLQHVGIAGKPGHEERLLEAIKYYDESKNRSNKQGQGLPHNSLESLTPDSSTQSSSNDQNSMHMEEGSCDQNFSHTTENGNEVCMIPLEKLVPKELKDLVIPEPLTDQLKFYNNLTQELYTSCYGAVSTLQFREYLLSQCIVRWRIKMSVEKIQKKFENLCSSNDGNAINIRKYTAEEVSQATSKDCKRVEDTIDIVEKLNISVQENINSMREHRGMLTGKSGEMKKWKSNELKFIDDNLELLKNISGQIDSITCKLMSTNKQLKRKFFAVDADEQEERRKERRKKDNAIKDKREKMKRLSKSCFQVLKLIAPNLRDVNGVEIEKLLEEGKFDIVKVAFGDLCEEPDLKAHFRLDALKHLKEKNVFETDALVKINSFIASMQEKKEIVEKYNKDRKLKAAIKQKSMSQQKTIADIFKK